MNRKIGILATLFIALALTLGGMQEAQAKRMGGGKSFGSRPSYSAPYQRSTTPNDLGNQATRSASQQQAAAQNQAARQNWAGRGGLMGMLGGLALGGLLGSLFFGGAFEGLNLMDMLLFAGIAYLVYRLFAAKAGQQPAANGAFGQAGGRPGPQYYRDNQGGNNNPTGFDTDVLFGKNKAGAGNSLQSTAATTAIPADFDRAAFLNGAEKAYRYLQAAWDNRDLAEIRGLATDKVFAEIQQQLQASGETNRTEILSLKSELLEVSEAGAELEASVLFESLIRENAGQPETVREVWHFVKPKHSNQTRWFLDGIQQIEE
ncbi:preprotein translocase subunit Tim44 [Methylomonas koyamae]|uniref:Preprotein translocase subunit Tim44 n=1 Tax=Methylomonas koyamae TaxID=702114 RepID=A0A177N9J3_9GAMM|nr:Tim44-like domain-containing protein [Methylomonas koyamae]OAI14617.1 preprotein translocase subunit Tim44 [Methylomonas koyamae]